MKKNIFFLLPALLIMFASCMDSAGRNSEGSVRVVLPGGSRETADSEKADSYKVSLMQDKNVIKTQTSVPGGAVEFDDLEQGTYSISVEASFKSKLSGVGDNDVNVVAGETASCTVKLSRVLYADNVVEYINSLESGKRKVIVAGEINEDTIDSIADVLENTTKDISVILDLNRTTGLEKIENYAFDDCAKLIGIFLPSTIKSIGDYAFRSSGLENVIILSGVTSIGSSAFNSCSGLKSVEIPFGVTKISDSVFRNCTALKSVTIPGGVSTISNSAFQGCSGLESITIPDSITSIGNSAFSDSGIVSIEIPSSVTEIDLYAFKSCKNLKSATIPGGVSTISSSVFQGCLGLESVEILYGVEMIGSNTFANCTALKTITIPNSVITIGSNAFANCTALKSITIPSSVTSSDSSFVDSGLENIEIMDGVKKIGSKAFMSCTALKTITIPKSVETIEANAFYRCLKLERVIYKGSEEEWGNITKDSTGNSKLDEEGVVTYLNN